MPAAFLLGRKAKAYWGSTQIDDDSNDVETLLPAMTEATNIKDLTVNASKDLADITTRGDGGWKTQAGVLKDLSVDFDIKWLPSDTFFVALRDAYLNDTLIPFVVLDQSRNTVGAQGPAANWEVSSFTRDEGLGNVLMASVTLVPSSYPQWVETDAS